MIAVCGLLMVWIGFITIPLGTFIDSWEVPAVWGTVPVTTGLFRHKGSFTTETAKVVKCIQAFLILGNMFSLPAMVLGMAITAFRDRKCIVHRRKKIGTVAAIFCFCSGFFTLIGVIVYVAEFQDYKSFSFIFCVAGIVSFILEGFLIGLLVIMKDPDSQSVVSSSRQILSLPPTVTGNLSTEMVSLGHQRQRQQQAIEQQEQGRQQLQLQHQKEELQKKQKLLQQQQQQLQNHIQLQTRKRQPPQQLMLHQQQQLLHEQQRLQELENQLRLRSQQLGQRGEQLQQQQERQQQQQQMQHQLQTRRQHCQEGQNNNTCRSSSQPQIFTLSPPSYESLQPAPYSGAAPTQSPQPSYEPQTTSVEPLPPSYEPQTISVEPLPPPYESILPQPAETLPPSYESIQQYE